jgi:hypothetical protein
MDNIKEEIKTEEIDESKLDEELEASIKSVQAGKVLAPKEEAKAGEVEEETPEITKQEETSKPPVDEKKEGEYDFRVPNKGKFESDESYEKRIELLDLVKRRKLAKTDEQRQQLADEIKSAKSNLKTLNGADRFANPLNQKSEELAKEPLESEDENLAADKERLKALGGATKEDIEEMLTKDRLATDVKNTLDKFVDRHSELKDDDTREVFFDFVDSNYNWQNKSGKELMTVLELARENMFKPSETIQERVLKGANVQEKVNAMQFPGGSIAKTDFSPEMRNSINEIMATGVSEEKAIELLTD